MPFKARKPGEVFVHLVVATVFKTAEPYVNRAVGGFDSHTLPPFFSRAKIHLLSIAKWLIISHK